MTPDRITLQNLEKKQNESFRQYAQRWREVATQVQPPLFEKETTMLFINTLKAPFITHMLGSATKSFSDIVITGKMIENTVRNGKIDAGENFKRPTSRKKEGEVNNVSTYNKGYSKPITVGSPRTVATSHQGPPRQESNSRWWSKRLIKMGIVKLDDPSGPNVAGNSLPDHTDKGVNTIAEGGSKRIKAVVMEVKTPLKCVWEHIVCRGLITRDLDERPKGAGIYYEFHNKKGHNIQECTEFKTMVQNLMDNKEIEFYEEFKEFEEREICASEEGPIERFQKVNHPVVIISRPMSNEAGIQIPPKVIIQKSVPFSYKDNKKVPWNYDCNVTIPGEENPINALEESNDDGFYTCSGKRHDPTTSETEPAKGKALVVEHKKEKAVRHESPINEPVTESKAREFLKFLKHSEYSVVE
ncbi:uncharacterized protein LOC105797627 [Gossypium raimondii]|uniref:uncharacterized protein LOC105797627 n=1 Tax=Gossypium raimondii TaxID=29730 RepID=UPI00063AEE73|nr:uncharacterized protein LOC105797627 [Gossypium raimondii]